MLSLQEALTMQLDEMELLETAYPEVTFDDPDARPPLRAVLAQCLERQQGPPPPPPPQTDEQRDDDDDPRWLRSALADAPLISFRCPLLPPPEEAPQLRVGLPRRYPQVPLVATLEGVTPPRLTASARRAVADSAAGEAARLSGQLGGGEPQCLQVLGEAMRAAADLLADAELAAGGNSAPADKAVVCSQSCGGGGGGADGESPCGPHAREAGREGRTTADDVARSSSSAGPVVGAAVFLGRRLIYSHHIIATQKRTGIVKAARELRLGGFSKVGWPGVIVIEGEEANCADFVSTLRGWRWKHLAVRGEETSRLADGKTVDQERRLPLPLEELGEKEGVSALAKRCREAGLGELFSTLLR